MVRTIQKSMMIIFNKDANDDTHFFSKTVHALICQKLMNYQRIKTMNWLCF